jgi:hypothetical protein
VLADRKSAAAFAKYSLKHSGRGRFLPESKCSQTFSICLYKGFHGKIFKSFAILRKGFQSPSNFFQKGCFFIFILYS